MLRRRRTPIPIVLGAIVFAACGRQRDRWVSSGPTFTIADGSVIDANAANVDTTPVFRPCQNASDCPSRACILSYPHGLCTRPCNADVQCGTDGICTNGFCIPSCEGDRFDCTSIGAACAHLDAETAVCAPVCNAFPASGPCNAGLACDEERGLCSASPHAGRLVGSICTRDDECAGICLLVAGDVTFPDGYCVAPTVRPPAEDFVANAPLPTHGCPANTVILPLAGDAPGDYTYCWQQCHDDADCRTGYRCDHQGASSARFSDGACRPTR